MTLKRQFFLLSGVMIVALAALVGAETMLSQATNAVAVAYDTRYRSYLLAAELRQSSDDLTRLARTFALTGDAQWAEQYQAVLDIRNGKRPRPQEYHRIYWDFLAVNDTPPRPDGTAVPLLELMRAQGFTDEEFALLQAAQAQSDKLVELETVAMNAARGRFRPLGSQDFTLKRVPDLDMARSLMHSADYHRYKADIMAPVDQFFALMEQRTTRAVAAAEAAKSWWNQVAAACLGVVIAAILVLMVLLRQRVLVTLSRLQQAMTALVAGQIDTIISGTGRRDEIGAMASAVEVFRQDRLRLASLEQDRVIAQEDAERQRRRQLNELGHLFQQEIGEIANGLADSAANLSGSAQDLLTVVQDTTERAGTVSSASLQATQNVEAVAAATEQLATTTRVISDDVRRAQSISHLAVERARATNSTIDGLSAASRRIGEVVTLIHTIAEQTNLLALNATIEAARAGDAGRGFAVVASEVKTLAAQTARATDDIQTQIASIQSETLRAIEAIGAITSTISDVNDITTTIAGAVEQQGAATHEIARMVTEAAAGTGDVSRTIAAMRDDAGRTGQSAVTTQGLASALAGSAESLRQQLGRLVAQLQAA